VVGSSRKSRSGPPMMPRATSSGGAERRTGPEAWPCGAPARPPRRSPGQGRAGPGSGGRSDAPCPRRSVRRPRPRSAARSPAGSDVQVQAVGGRSTGVVLDPPADPDGDLGGRRSSSCPQPGPATAVGHPTGRWATGPPPLSHAGYVKITKTIEGPDPRDLSGTVFVAWTVLKGIGPLWAHRRDEGRRFRRPAHCPWPIHRERASACPCFVGTMSHRARRTGTA